MKQKLLSPALALALCLSLAGCRLSTPDTVGRIGDVEIGSGLYLLAQLNAYQQAAQYAADGQDTGDVKAFLKESITLGDGPAVTVGDYVADETVAALRRYAAVETRFAELGGALSADETAQADSYVDQIVENYSDFYAANGIGEETIRLYEYNLFKQSALVELLYGEGGETPLSDAELTSHLESEMVYADYVTVPLYNSSTFVFADGTQSAEMLDLARQAAAAASADDFEQVVAGALPGIYAVLDAEYTAEEAAGAFTSGLLTQSDLASYFSAEAADALRALGYGEAAALQSNSYSLMIAQRLDPLGRFTLDELRPAILSDMATSLVEQAMDDYGAALADGLDAAATAKLPASKIDLG